MKELHALALRNAKELRRLNGRIGETLRHRSSSAAGRAAWESACKEFHDRFDELFFPGGEPAWSRFIRGEAAFVENALAFLEADPWSVRSGYHKQVIWRYLKRLSLREEDGRRLEDIALLYLQKRVRWEFWHMAKYMRLRGRPEFWETVEALALSTERTAGAIKATWLVLVRANAPVRRCIGRELLRAKYETGYAPALDFGSPRHET
jgi:hypothetical protein